MKSLKNKKLFLLVVVLVLVAGGGAYAFISNRSSNVGKSGVIPAVTSKKQSATTTTSPTTTSTTTKTTSGSQITTDSSDKTVTPPASSGSGPSDPSGSFVSSHSVSLNNGGGEESECLTTPGATCTISFTSGSVVKTLPVQTAGSDGSTMWNWNAKDAGLTTGSWQITASAVLNGQTKKTTDLQDLKVQQ